MTMKKHLIYIIGIAATLFTACDTISEAERFLEVESLVPQRVVLLEDYTGQACVNCPDAHGVATELHELYPENIIVVAMHAGMQGIAVENKGLKQPEGDEYANKAGVEKYPSGHVNRRGKVLDNTTDWAAVVFEEMERPSKVKMEVSASIEDGKLSVETSAQASENISAKLQLWLLEDSIVSFQVSHAGMNPQYVHNHVFRDAINGTWGEDVVLGKIKTIEHKGFELNSDWKPEDLSVVAFVYNNDGVLQASQCKVVVNE